MGEDEKSLALLRAAICRSFEGPVQEAALDYLDELQSAAGARSALEAKLAEAEEKARKTANAGASAEARGASLAAKRDRMRAREKDMGRGRIICADGLPAMLGETLYGSDGRGWEIIGTSDEAGYELRGGRLAAKKWRSQPLKAAWLTHEPPAKEREPEKPEVSEPDGAPRAEDGWTGEQEAGDAE